MDASTAGSYVATNAHSLVGPISGSNIPAGTITSRRIAPGAVTGNLIAPGTVNAPITVASASQTAAAGTAYNANCNDLSTFNLPASADMGAIKVAWPTSVPGWVLQVNTADLNNAAWTDAAGAPTVNGTEQLHSFPMEPGRAFFRLRFK